MKAFFRKTVCVLTVWIMLCQPGLAASRDEIRRAYRNITELRASDSLFFEMPDPETHTAGALTDEAQNQALAYLNFLRGLAGLEPVSISPLYALRSQNGALLLAENDVLSHTPDRPNGMDDALYASAYLGTSLGNIAKFNWMKADMLLDGISYFARDDGENNLFDLSHRRWLLNPAMAETGFGLAESASGMRYIVMYAVDGGNANAAWSCVCWPAQGCFPADLMRNDIAWSVSLNDSAYEITSDIAIRMTEEKSGAVFLLAAGSDDSNGFCTVSREACGSGSCIIFRPNLESAGINAYEQNQIWQIQITGLNDRSGSPADISYRCEMISLLPQDPANVELSVLEAEMKPGEELQLRADVIPAYADDLCVSWTSSDEGVARVDASGAVTAVAQGACTITATAVNGRSDCCAIRVDN